MTKAQSLVWEERYRPQSLDEVSIPNDIKKQVSGSTIQNLMFYGPAGTGKSTLAKIIAKRFNTLFINASLENDVNTIRHKIDNFCALQSLDSNAFKLVILDESDFLSTNAQAALRGVIELYASTARFIFTCNYPDKLIEPIRSRLEEINFEFPLKEHQAELLGGYVKRINLIASENGMSLSKDSLIKISKEHYPDYRGALQTLEGLHRRGIADVKVTDLVGAANIKYADLFEFIISTAHPAQLYTLLSAYKGQERQLLTEFNKNFIKFITAKQGYESKLGDIAIKIHKYSVESKSAIDEFITVLALAYDLSLIIKK